MMVKFMISWQIKEMDSMETKMITIPFDIERAKRIQAGEEPGKITIRDERSVRIVCWDMNEEGYPIVGIITNDNGKEWVTRFTKAGEYYVEGGENKCDLMLQVPEWTQCKKGDIVSCEIENGDDDFNRWYGIVKKVDCTINGDSNGYVEFVVIWNLEQRNTTDYVEMNYSTNYFDCINLATEEERQRFIERLKEQIYDPDLKKILKEYFGIEEKPECEFEFLQPVLVRFNPSYNWCYGNFTHMSGELHCISGGNAFKYCIPYNEQTKHLLGTTDNWEE